MKLEGGDDGGMGGKEGCPNMKFGATHPSVFWHLNCSNVDLMTKIR